MRARLLVLIGVLWLQPGPSHAAPAGKPLAVTVASSLTVPRAGHTATLLRDGSVLVVGGSKDGTSAERYSPNANRWTSLAPMHVARSLGHSATLLPDGQVFVAGGASVHCAAEFENELFDPASGTWRSAGSLTERRYGHSATLLPNGTVLIVGGRTWACDGDWPAEYASVVELCEPLKGHCRSIDGIELHRAFHRAEILPNELVLLAGGETYLGEHAAPASTPAAIFDLAHHQTIETSTVVAPGSSTLTALPTGQLVLVGARKADADAAHLYNPRADKWTTISGCPRVVHHSASLLEHSRILLAGGALDDARAASRQLALFTPPGQCRQIGVLPEPRMDHTSTVLKDGHVLVVGGRAAQLGEPKSTAWMLSISAGL